MTDPLDYRTQIAEEGLRMSAVARGHLNDAVPTCPDYDVAGLLGHTGQVFAFVNAQLLADDLDNPATPGPEGQFDDESDLIAWFDDRLSDLLDALDEAGTDKPTWTFGIDKTSTFYHRRMAHETGVHRWDADNAVNGTGAQPVSRPFAIDGIDEMYEVTLRRVASREGFAPPAGSLHLHATDGEGEWLLTTDGGGIVMTHEHAKGDAAVRGSASDLLLFLWGRGSGSTELFGNESIAGQWATLAP